MNRTNVIFLFFVVTAWMGFNMGTYYPIYKQTPIKQDTVYVTDTIKVTDTLFVNDTSLDKSIEDILKNQGWIANKIDKLLSDKK